MKEKFDLVVVGAGLTGASIAYWAKQKWGVKTLVLESESAAFGASGRNAGFMTCGSVLYFEKLMDLHGKKRALEIWKFCEENHQLLREHIVQDPRLKELEYRQNGSLSLARDVDVVKRIHQSAELMSSEGLDVQKDIDFFGKKGAAYNGDGSISPEKLVNEILTKSGCELRIEKFESEEQLRKKYHFDRLVQATNGYSDGFGVEPIRAQCLLTGPVEKKLASNIYLCDELAYLRQRVDGRVICGGLRHLDPDNEIGREEKLHSEIQEKLLVLAEEFLGLRLSVDKRWSGTMGFTDSTLPVIFQLKENSFFLGGYSGHGMGMAFHSAKKFVEFLDGREPPVFFTKKHL